MLGDGGIYFGYLEGRESLLGDAWDLATSCATSGPPNWHLD